MDEKTSDERTPLRLGRTRGFRQNASSLAGLVLIFIAAAILTPPDVISQVGLALPMLLLYEISIYLVRRFEKRRAEKEAEEAAAEAGGRDVGRTE